MNDTQTIGMIFMLLGVWAPIGYTCITLNIISVILIIVGISFLLFGTEKNGGIVKEEV